MNNNTEIELLNLLRKGSELHLIDTHGFDLNREDDEVLSDKEVRIISFSGKDYRIVFNKDVVYNASIHKQRFEYLNRASLFVRDLLKLIFNEYNVLYVEKSKAMIDFQRIGNENRPDCADNIEISVETSPSDQILDEYKLQLGLLVELKDSFENGVTPFHTISDCFVSFQNGKPQFVFDSKIIPEVSDSKTLLEPIEIEKHAELKEKIDAILKELNDKERKSELFHELIKHDENIINYLTTRNEIATKHHINYGNVEFNINPVTISINKVELVNLNYYFTVKNPDNSESLIENDSKYGPLTHPNLDPFQDIKLEHHCPNCNALITPDNKLNIAIGEKRCKILACQSCSKKPSEIYADPYLNSQIRVDCFDQKEYYADDMVDSALTGLPHYLKNTVLVHLLDGTEGYALPSETMQIDDNPEMYPGNYLKRDYEAAFKADDLENGKHYLIKDMTECFATGTLHYHKNMCLVHTSIDEDKYVIPDDAFDISMENPIYTGQYSRTDFKKNFLVDSYDHKAYKKSDMAQSDIYENEYHFTKNLVDIQVPNPESPEKPLIVKGTPNESVTIETYPGVWSKKAYEDPSIFLTDSLDGKKYIFYDFKEDYKGEKHYWKNLVEVKRIDGSTSLCLEKDRIAASEFNDIYFGYWLRSEIEEKALIDEVDQKRYLPNDLKKDEITGKYHYVKRMCEAQRINGSTIWVLQEGEALEDFNPLYEGLWVKKDVDEEFIQDEIDHLKYLPKDIKKSSFSGKSVYYKKLVPIIVGPNNNTQLGLPEEAFDINKLGKQYQTTYLSPEFVKENFTKDTIDNLFYMNKDMEDDAVTGEKHVREYLIRTKSYSDGKVYWVEKKNLVPAECYPNKLFLPFDTFIDEFDSKRYLKSDGKEDQFDQKIHFKGNFADYTFNAKSGAIERNRASKKNIEACPNCTLIYGGVEKDRRKYFLRHVATDSVIGCKFCLNKNKNVKKIIIKSALPKDDKTPAYLYTTDPIVMDNVTGEKGHEIQFETCSYCGQKIAKGHLKNGLCQFCLDTNGKRKCKSVKEEIDPFEVRQILTNEYKITGGFNYTLERNSKGNLEYRIRKGLIFKQFIFIEYDEKHQKIEKNITAKNYNGSL